MAREFEIRREVELPATPEEVWEAVATSEGNKAWLFPNLVDPADVKVSDPPRRFMVRTEGEGGFFNAIEDVIEARGGGTTVLRYVHSGIVEEDWDTQYDAANQHTDFYLHTLGQYLRHFKGRSATYVGDVPGGIEAPPASSEPGALGVVCRALGLTGGAAEGDRVQLDVDGQAIDGVVDYLRPHFLGVRTADGMYRFFARGAWGGPVGLTMHLFADDVDAERTEQSWRAWLQGVFA
jgi:hypothetical protein